MSAFKMSPVRVVGTLHDGVHVKVKDRTVKKFGNHRDAGHFQNGYDRCLREVLAAVRNIVPTEGETYTADDWARAIEEEFGEA